jgi:ABC-2 type transport system ATP-binding protein
MATDDGQQQAIVVEGLTKRYGELLAVDNISFTVKKGEVFSFLGPNGAGKSTTVEIIETIRLPTSGRVSVLGMDVATRKRDIVPRIGVLPQGFNSFDRITVKETIRYYAQLFGAGHADLDGLMDLTNLRGKQDEQFKKLSGGLKQRVGIAIALVNDPEVVFLDEPTTGLDPHARREVWKVLQGLKSRGKTVFLTTHYLEEAELLADTVAIISKGKMVAMGSPETLIQDNADYLTVTLSPDRPEVFAVIQEMGLDPVHHDGGHIRTSVSRIEDVTAILNAIRESGASVLSLDVRKPNLEEVFLKLTGETLDDEATAGVSA